MKVGLSAILALCLLLTLHTSVQANEVRQAATYTFETEEQERQYRRLIHELRCATCQNQSVADSNAPLAVDFRERVYQMTMDGYSREEIIEFMRDRYGDFVHYQPPMNASTIILWAGPALVLLGGILAIALMVFSQRKRRVELSSEEQSRLDQLLREEQDSAHNDSKKERGE